MKARKKQDVRTIRFGVLLVGLALLSWELSAQTTDEIPTRDRFIQNDFEAGQASARFWYYGYMAFYGAVALGSAAAAGTARLPRQTPQEYLLYKELGASERQLRFWIVNGTYYVNPNPGLTYALQQRAGHRGLIGAAILDRNYRRARAFEEGKQNQIVNGWLGLVGLSTLAFMDFPQVYAAGALAEIDDPDQRTQAGEAYLETAADRSSRTHGASGHARAVFAGLLSAVGLVGPYHRSAADGYRRFAQAFLMNELQNFLMPSRARRTRERYSRQYGETGGIRFESFVVYPEGVALVFSF